MTSSYYTDWQEDFRQESSQPAGQNRRNRTSSIPYSLTITYDSVPFGQSARSPALQPQNNDNFSEQQYDSRFDQFGEPMGDSGGGLGLSLLTQANLSHQRTFSRAHYGREYGHCTNPDTQEIGSWTPPLTQPCQDIDAVNSGVVFRRVEGHIDPSSISFRQQQDLLSEKYLEQSLSSGQSFLPASNPEPIYEQNAISFPLKSRHAVYTSCPTPLVANLSLEPLWRPRGPEVGSPQQWTELRRLFQSYVRMYELHAYESATAVTPQGLANPYPPFSSTYSQPCQTVPLDLRPTVRHVHSSQNEMYSRHSPLLSPLLNLASNQPSRSSPQYHSSRQSEFELSFNSWTMEEVQAPQKKRHRVPKQEQVENRRLIRRRGGACIECSKKKRKCNLNHPLTSSPAASEMSDTTSSRFSYVHVGTASTDGPITR